MANGNVFKPAGAYSAPTIESELVLQTEQAKRIFNRCFEGAGRALYTTDVITRALANTNARFDHGEVMTAINTMLSKLEKDINDGSERFKVLLKANGQEAARARYNGTETVVFPISTPEILRFAKILASFDEMIQLFDTAWLVGLVDSKKAQSFRTDQLRMVMRIVRKLQSQATMARKKARSEGTKETIEALTEVLVENDAEKTASAEVELAGTEQVDTETA